MQVLQIVVIVLGLALGGPVAALLSLPAVDHGLVLVISPPGPTATGRLPGRAGAGWARATA